MKTLVRVLCGAAALALVPACASAFEIQSEGDRISESAAEFEGLTQTWVQPQFNGSSLAMPYNSKTDGSSFVSDYGNSIPIPGPGIDQPAPAWAYRGY
jgi:hypothetical protein